MRVRSQTRRSWTQPSRTQPSPRTRRSDHVFARGPAERIPDDRGSNERNPDDRNPDDRGSDERVPHERISDELRELGVGGVIVTTTQAQARDPNAPDPDETLSTRLRDLALVDLGALTAGLGAA